MPRLVGAGGFERGRRRVDAIAERGAQPREDVGGRRSREPAAAGDARRRSPRRRRRRGRPTSSPMLHHAIVADDVDQQLDDGADERVHGEHGARGDEQRPHAGSRAPARRCRRRCSRGTATWRSPRSRGWRTRTARTRRRGGRRPTAARRARGGLRSAACGGRSRTCLQSTAPSPARSWGADGSGRAASGRARGVATWERRHSAGLAVSRRARWHRVARRSSRVG